jgi:hypothetical protein
VAAEHCSNPAARMLYGQKGALSCCAMGAQHLCGCLRAVGVPPTCTQLCLVRLSTSGSSCVAQHWSTAVHE